MWLQIRPGTDLALMLGWIRLIIEEELYDADFVAKWTVGFDELKEAVQEYTPEKVSKITWLPVEQITAAARIYATSKPAQLPYGYGLDKQGINSNQCARARAILRAITGNLEIQGGETFSQTPEVARVRGEFDLVAARPSARSSGPSSSGRTPTPFSAFRAGKAIWPTTASCPGARSTRRPCTGPAWPMPGTSSRRPSPKSPIRSRPCSPWPATPCSPSRTAENGLRSAPEALELYVVMEYYMTPPRPWRITSSPRPPRWSSPNCGSTGGFCMACPPGIDPLYRAQGHLPVLSRPGAAAGSGKGLALGKSGAGLRLPFGAGRDNLQGADRAIWLFRQAGIQALRETRASAPRRARWSSIPRSSRNWAAIPCRSTRSRSGARGNPRNWPSSFR
jgi:thiosulfate reductase / polysulfide reductase chain A